LRSHSKNGVKPEPRGGSSEGYKKTTETEEIETRGKKQKRKKEDATTEPPATVNKENQL